MTRPVAPVPALPPSLRPFVSDDLDQVRSFVGRIDGEHSRVAHGAGPLGYRHHVVRSAGAALVWVRANQSQTVRGAFGYPFIHLPIDQVSTYLFGRRRQEAAPGRAMFVAPGWEHTRRAAAGAQFAFGMDGAALAAEVHARRLGTPGPWSWQSGALPPDGCEWVSAVEALAQVLTDADDPRRRALCEARAIAAVARLLLRGATVAAARPLAPARLAAVCDWIDAHLGEPVTLGRLSRVAGVGERCLQLGFEQHRGTSPMRFVLERRLAVAHRRLRRATPGERVTDVAIDTGFSHLGRFATLYRSAYGEPPSQTLQGATSRLGA
jgi:AraC-like DNA-binding protein